MTYIGEDFTRMKLLRSILLVIGLILVGGGVAGIRRLHYSTSDGLALTGFSGLPRWFTLAQGLLLLMLFAALGRRSLQAWRFVCGLFVLAIVQLLAQGICFALGSTGTNSDRVWDFVSQALCALLLVLIFVRWWLPKRKGFTR